MLEVRRDYRLTRRIVADRIGLSADQLNRIERELVSLRFGPGWHFCEMTETNLLWLAFGDPYPRLGFGPMVTEISEEEQSEPFFDFMDRLAKAYGADPKITETRLSELQGLLARSPEKFKNLVDLSFKQYLTKSIAVKNWGELKTKLIKATRRAGARAALAREFNVTPAAVSQWLSGASAPTADTALRLQHWLKKPKHSETKKSRRPRRSATAAKTKKGKSLSNEKPNSNRKKK